MAIQLSGGEGFQDKGQWEQMRKKIGFFKEEAGHCARSLVGAWGGLADEIRRKELPGEGMREWMLSELKAVQDPWEAG